MSAGTMDDSWWGLDPVARFEAEAAPSVGELLARQARAHHDLVAIDMLEQDVQLTYGELDRQVSQLADGFRQVGVARGDRVAIMLPNRMEYPVTWLALARLGAVSVGVNPRYTPFEVEGIIRETEPTHMVLAASLPVPRWLSADRVISVGDSQAAGEFAWRELLEGGAADFRPNQPITRQDVLAILYTSGSTGSPKGAMLTHKYWLLQGLLGAHLPGMPSIGSALAEAPLYYFDGLAALMTTLSSGGTLHQAVRYSSSRFVQRARATRAEAAFLPVPMPPASAQDRDHAIKVLTGFDLTPELVREVENRFGAPVREAYGMTEVGVCLRVPLSLTDEEAIGTCGLPTPTYELKVVASDGTATPRGTSGELWVRGPGVMNGYWRRPEANAESFVDGWFRTGDLFVHEATGYYRFVGRIKAMIKRSGENISAHEVQGVIRQHPDVLDAFVIPVPDDYRGQEVKAFVRLRDGVGPDTFDPADLRAHCRRFLAAFKCPRYICMIDEMPLTGSGKVDGPALELRHDLPVWDAESTGGPVHVDESPRPVREGTVPVWMLTDEEIIARAGNMRAGQDLSPTAWPAGRVAVLLSVDVDNETAFMEDGDTPSWLLSRLEYGGRRGLRRLVDLFDEYEVPASFFTPAMSLKIAPHMADDIARSGRHEVALHGWVHEGAAQLSEDEHRSLLTRSAQYLESVFGERPVGYRTPWGPAPDPFAPHTLSLLKEIGVLYDSSLFSDDRPYELHLDGEPTGIIEIPACENTVDTLMAMNLSDSGGISHTPQAVFDMLRDEFDLAYREGTMFHAILHPHISGQRAQAGMLRRFVEYVAAKDVWFATHRQAAEHVSSILGAP